MYNPEVFIITNRKELSIKHKKLIETLNCNVKIFSRLDEAILNIKNSEPEVILVSDTIDDVLSDFIKKIRILTYNYRPVIIAISKSDAMDDKLNALEAGADDFLDEATRSKEFQARLNAHIRRFLENSTNTVTNLVENKVTLKALRRTIRENLKRAVLFINISGINFYKEIYGEIAYEKVLQTLAAIINPTLQNEDILGHYSPKEFILITAPAKAEKIAKFLTFAFDSVLEKFYSEFDYKNNFMLYSSESIEEKKIPLMKLAISVVETGEGKFENEKQVLNLLFNTLKLCKTSKNSCYIIDRPKLYGEVSKIQPKNKVMIMEQDNALSCLLEVSLNMQGYETKVCTGYENFDNEYVDFCPDVLILDYGNEHKKQGFDVLGKIKEKNNPPKIIFSTTIQDKKNILSLGADLYMPKPYDINTLLDWVKKLI